VSVGKVAVDKVRDFLCANVNGDSCGEEESSAVAPYSSQYSVSASKLSDEIISSLQNS
jgi:hypothetical protein